MDGALVVDRQAREPLEVLVLLVGVVHAAGLVPEAPHDYRRMHLVALVHPGRAVNVVRLPRRIVADAVIAWRQLVDEGAVRLEICLVDDVYAELVAELQKIRIRRVV